MGTKGGGRGCCGRPSFNPREEGRGGVPSRDPGRGGGQDVENKERGGGVGGTCLLRGFSWAPIKALNPDLELSSIRCYARDVSDEKRGKGFCVGSDCDAGGRAVVVVLGGTAKKSRGNEKGKIFCLLP